MPGHDTPAAFRGPQPAARAEAIQDLLAALAAEAGPLVSIRASLARKLAAHAVELAQDQGREPDWEVLRVLARDRERQVRHAVADTLADLPDAPHDLVRDLARDSELQVCEPLIRLSRVLTQEDLLDLVRAPPDPDSRRTVARRLGVTEAVAEAVVASGDVPAIVALLHNPTAHIPAGTLAALAALADLARGQTQLRQALQARNPSTNARDVGVIEASQI